MNREDALKQIISFGPDLDEAYSVVLSHPLSPDNEVVVASCQSIAVVLRKYIADEVSVDDLEEWAMFVDCRDDVDCSQIDDYVYALTNPELMDDIDKEKAAVMVELLAETHPK